MNRRTFIKYLSCAPIALVTLARSHLTSSVVRKKEKDEELDQKEKKRSYAYYDRLRGQGRLVKVKDKWYVKYNATEIWEQIAFYQKYI